MPLVSIGGIDYDVYISVADADLYLAGQFAATTWRAQSAGAETKAVAIVSATRLLDRQLWMGEKTDSYSPHAFPRTGLFYPYAPFGAVPSDAVPQEVIDATAELASAIMEGALVQGGFGIEAPGAGMIASLTAGSVSISYFRGLAWSERFPQIIMELLGFWLLGRGAVGYSIATGTDRESAFEDEYDFTTGI